MRVPMSDPSRSYLFLKEQFDEVFQKVAKSGIFENGPELENFERELGKFLGASYAVGVGSGSTALELALRSAGVGPGDEVITVPNSDISTSAVINHCGADVIWVDIDEHTYNMDVEQLEKSISSQTKAILVVHMYGHPVEMDPIIEIARINELIVIEDCALAFGALYRGKRVGTIGDMGCFSFAPRKALGAFGDGGAVVTNNSSFAEKVRLLGSYGEVRKKVRQGNNATWQPLIYMAEGYHSHLDELQAALLRVKLPYADEWIGLRQSAALRYRELTEDLPITHPYRMPHVTHAMRTYIVRLSNRDSVQHELADALISTGLHYVPPMHLQPVYKNMGFSKGTFPVTEKVADELLCLPMFPELTGEEIEHVCKMLRRSVEKHAG